MNSHIRIFLFFEVILLISCFAYCYAQEPYEFPEGIYKYNGEPILLYQDVTIEDISIEFKESDIDYDDLEDKTNYIQNRKSKKTYELIFLFKRQDENEYIQMSFISLPKRIEQVDRYYIDIDLTNLMKEEASGIFCLFFQGRSNDENVANELTLELRDMVVNENEIKGCYAILNYVEENI